MSTTSNVASIFGRIKTGALLVLSALLVSALLVSNTKAQTENVRPTVTVSVSTQDPARGRSVVKGRAVFDDTGQPAPAQRVLLISTQVAATSGPSGFFSSGTNDKGEFTFNGIAAGEYYVVGQPFDPRSSYPFPMPAGDPADSARLEQFRQTATRVSVDGQTGVEIELRVPNPHFGAISGYVLNPNGEMLARTRVNCSSVGQDRLHAFGFAVMTDEKGAFKFERLPPGQYLLSADPPPKDPQATPGMTVTQSFTPTFYLSTTNSAAAVPINVSPDFETSGIDIRLVGRSAHTIAGSVRMRVTGAPVSSVVVRLSPITSGSLASSNSRPLDQPTAPQIQRADKDGRWSFSNIPDGPYVLTIDATQPAPSREGTAAPPTAAPPKFSAKRQELTVDGSDLQDVAIELSAGGRISGRVVVEGDQPLPPRTRIMAGATEGQPPSTATLEADGSFVLNGVPEGEVSLVPQLRPPNTFYVKAIEAGGVDLLREPLTIEEGTEIKNVRVVISSAVALLTGQVLNAQRKTPLARVAVFLVPVDAAERLPNAQFTAMTTSDGVFSIGAAPGDYIVVAWQPGDPSPLDPAALAANKLRVTLRAAERQTMNILK